MIKPIRFSCPVRQRAGGDEFIMLFERDNATAADEGERPWELVCPIIRMGRFELHEITEETDIAETTKPTAG